MAKVVKLFEAGRKSTPDGTTTDEEVRKNADGTVTITLDLDEGVADSVDRLFQLSGGLREEGVTEANVAFRMRQIRENGLDHEASLARGGSWAEAVRRIQGKSSGAVVSTPPPEIQKMLGRIRTKTDKGEKK